MPVEEKYFIELTSALVFICSFIGVYFYSFFALRENIIATPNFRTLHEADTPSGGGLIFSLIFIIGITGLVIYEYLPLKPYLILLLGGLLATIVGFLDDVFDVPAKIKLLVQFLLSIATIIFFNGISLSLDVSYPPVHLDIIGNIIGLFVLVWLINLYNFMDGIDGMAGSGAIFISLILAIILTFHNQFYETSMVFYILSASCLGFLVLNWPKASVFMGDSGTLFLGFVFGVLICKTMQDSMLSIWTWIIVFGYFISDTTTTLLVRIFRVKKWYGAHRSHAYQNLARIWGSHRKVLFLVLGYELFWLMPLAIFSVKYSQHEIIAALLAIVPVILWTLKYGPFLSNV